MDILISSNLERLLFDVTGHDTEKVAGWMKELSETGRYQVDAETLAAIQEVFVADYCDDKTTEETIAEVYESTIIYAIHTCGCCKCLRAIFERNKG